MDQLPSKVNSVKWKSLASPVLAVVCLYFVVKIGLSDAPFLVKSETFMGQGRMPMVEYRPSAKLWSSVTFFVLFNIFLFIALRHWARYFLNRKMILSYLFFAIVPLLTNIFIITSGVQAWFGISNTIVIEKIMEIHSQELKNFVLNIQNGIGELLQQSRLVQFDETTKNDIREIVDASTNSELNSLRSLRSGAIPVDVYWQTEKRPGEPQLLAQLYSTTDDLSKRDTPFFTEDSPQYEEIYPTWLMDPDWTDIVSEDGALYIRHFNSAPQPGGALVTVASIPIERSFLNRMKDFKTARIKLVNREKTRNIATDGDEGDWYLRLMLRPFSSKWDILSLNWNSGYYEEYGLIQFEIEPTALSRALGDTGDLHLFYGQQKKSTMIIILIFAMVLILSMLTAIILGLYLIGYITRSLNVIAYGHEQVASGRLSYRLPYIGKDQLGAMGRSFNSMVSNIESLMNQVAEKEKYQEELRIARDIQMSLLPSLEDLDKRHRIHAACIPAREVGGDYYEILLAGNGEVGVFIADVSGKGTSAAFYMAELKGVLLALRHLWTDPRALMMGLNEILQPALAANVFVSAAYLLLNSEAKTGQLVRAGHCPSFHIKPDGTVTELMPPGIAVGIAKNDVFGKILQVEQFALAENDKVLMYTDGLDEMTFDEEMYGRDRLKDALRRGSAMDVEGLKNAILEDVLGFMSSEGQDDDLTLVVAALSREASQR